MKLKSSFEGWFNFSIKQVILHVHASHLRRDLYTVAVLEEVLLDLLLLHIPVMT